MIGGKTFLNTTTFLYASVGFLVKNEVVRYMLNDVLCNPGVYTNGYSVCIHVPFVYWKMVEYQNVTPV